MKIYSLITIALMFVSGCTNLPLLSDSFTVTDHTGNHIEYHGNATASGAMLVGTMGATGIAIGIAIDEGIEKAINDEAVAVGFSIEGIVSDWLRQGSLQKNFADQYNKCSSANVHINSISLSHLRGVKDAIYPIVDISVKSPGCHLSLQFDDAEKSERHHIYANLDDVKTNGEELVRLFKLVLDQIKGKNIANKM